MRTAGRKLAVAASVLAAWVTVADAAYEDRSAAKRALYTSIAMVANVVPVVSTLYAPRCLPGYIVCKATFAAMSVIAAGDQLFFSGGGDLDQTRGILHRGFAGDWYLTGRHVSGDVTPQPLPDPPPPANGGEGKWEPPPL